MNFPLILVCGQSGTGKSYSFRNLPKDRTKIFNIERKYLPFKEAVKFTRHEDISNITTFHGVNGSLAKALASKDFDIIVIDSFTKYLELLLAHSRDINKGYDIYTYYNKLIGNMLELVKANQNKFVILTSIDERVEDIKPTGAITTSRRSAVSGKEWEGKIEKEFTIVLFTDVKQERGKPAEYRFLVNNDGTNSAKSPPELFKTGPEMYIPNDLNMVIEKVRAYYELPVFGEPKIETPAVETKQPIPSLQTYGQPTN